MKFTKDQVKEAVATIFGLLAQGESDKKIAKKMGLTSEEYDKLKAAMFDVKADEIRTKPNEHVYVEYFLNQMNNVHDLSKLIEKFSDSKQYTALVGAVRARAEIYDKLIARGQEFGLIRKEPERKQIVAGVMVAELTNNELKKLVTQELNSLNKLNRRFGDGSLLGLPEPDDLYYGPTTEQRERKKTPQHMPERSKVQADVEKPRKARKMKATEKPLTINVEIE